MTAQRFLDDIQFILESGHGFYEVFETEEKTLIEHDKVVLERICSEIRIAKKKEKEEQQNIKITNDMLTKIANDPVLMHQLLSINNIK